MSNELLYLVPELHTQNPGAMEELRQTLAAHELEEKEIVP
jgi:hypothetical protein